MSKKKPSIADLIQPNGNRVFIKKLDRPTQTKSGLIYIVNDPAKGSIDNMGIIVAIGNDIEYKEACKVGVRVLFDEVLETSMDIEDEQYVVIRETNIECFFYDSDGGEDGM
jgi:co-chaperonin GroES (HSP10)